MNLKALIFFCCLIISATSFAQRVDSSAAATSPHNKRLLLIASSEVAAYTGAMIGLWNVWYSQSAHQSFRFFNDIPEWKQMDKMGHIYSAFHIAQVDSRILQWGRLPKKKSDRIAAITSMAIMSSIEVFDGFSAAYGASVGDLAANATGNLIYLGQSLAWNEIRIYPKFSYHQTSLAPRNPAQLGSGFSEELLKDYNGQTYWMSVDMDKFIRFPKWLNLCVGYGAQNMLNARDSQNLAQGSKPFRQYYVGIDFDLTAFRSRSKFLNSVIYVVNMIRIPAPALEFSDGKFRAHGLYF